MLKVGLLAIVLGLTSGCQKSDVENCVEASMDEWDESRLMDGKTSKTDPGLMTRKEWRSFSYKTCLAVAAPKVGS